ncbi:MAG: hypothetical protein BGO51_16330 [Rhodospirillales bacterium 69-11]|nr:MAG: hypothetical protein BGO51_16330 [Rhodospirillales bacterium 69-11]
MAVGGRSLIATAIGPHCLKGASRQDPTVMAGLRAGLPRGRVPVGMAGSTAGQDGEAVPAGAVPVGMAGSTAGQDGGAVPAGAVPVGMAGSTAGHDGEAVPTGAVPVGMAGSTAGQDGEAVPAGAVPVGMAGATAGHDGRGREGGSPAAVDGTPPSSWPAVEPAIPTGTLPPRRGRTSRSIAQALIARASARRR